MTKLPEWLEDVLPEIREVEYIDFDILSGTYTFRGEDYHTPLQAYRAATKEDENFAYTQAALNTPDITEGPLGPMYNDPNGKNYAWIAPYTDNHRKMHLEMIYDRFLELDKKYSEKPENWVSAYHWLNTHPCFWTRRKNEPTWDWNTDRGVNTFYTMVYTSDEGFPMVGFEAGGHTPCYTLTYHDLDMEVYEPSFEAAYIAMAKVVDRIFNTDGSRKDGADLT